MKHHQRLDYGRLAEVLHERGLANVDAIRELLQQSREGGMPFCEALVTTNLVPDWDLSRVVCETFNLPFLPVDMVEPNPKIRADIDLNLFRSHQVIPFDRFGQVLTVIMPALVSADVLGLLSASSDFVILAFVGTVETNRRWILEHLGAARTVEIEGGWSNLFDQADAEVTASLGGFPEPSEGGLHAGSDSFLLETPGARGPGGQVADEFQVDDLQFELAPPRTVVPEDDSLDLNPLTSFDRLGDVPALESAPVVDDDDAPEMPPRPQPRATKGPSAGKFELPPMPDFGGGRQAS